MAFNYSNILIFFRGCFVVGYDIYLEGVFRGKYAVLKGKYNGFVNCNFGFFRV